MLLILAAAILLPHFHAQPVAVSATPVPATPRPVSTPAETAGPKTQRDLQLEVSSLVASAENVMLLWRERRVALTTSEAKFLNGQRVAEAGRTHSEALDQLKSTYQKERIFTEMAEQKQRQITEEVSRYLELAQNLATAPRPLVMEAFTALKEERLGFPARAVLPFSLARQHMELRYATGSLPLDRVSSDFETNSLP